MDDKNGKNGHNHSAPWYIGVHTLLPSLQKNEKMLQHLPLLAMNHGRLPPFMVCVGDKRRAKMAASLLDDCVMVHELCAEHNAEIGRVAIGIGTYKGTPICVFEHQMGCGACEIICREMLAPDISSRHYRTKDYQFEVSHKHVIRVGSCGGINGRNTPEQEMVKVWDIISASHSVGVTGCSIQSLTGTVDFLRLNQKEAIDNFQKAGYTLNGSMLVQKMDDDFTTSIQKACQEKLNDRGVALTAHHLGNFAKDSLYAETKEDNFMKLRDEQRVGCTEMELDVILRAAHVFSRKGEPIKVGMACVVVGVIPGASFAEVNKDARKKRSTAMECAVLGSFEALHRASLRGRRGCNPEKRKA